MPVEFRAPRNDAELDDTIECSAVAFGGGEWVRTLFINITKHDPWFCLENTRACFVDGRPVSVVQIFDRPMRIGDCVVRMGGVGSVGTHPDSRSHGYSQAVLRDAVRYMEREGYDLSLLGAGVPSHYARAGWIHHPTFSFQIELGAEPAGAPPAAEAAEEGPATAVEPFEPGQHLAEVMAVYDAFNRARTGAIVRTAEYWESVPKWKGLDLGRSWVTRSESRIAAYLLGSENRIDEFGCLPGAEDALGRLVRHAFAAAAGDGKERLNANIPPAYRRLFESGSASLSREESSAWMARIFDLEPFLRKLAPLLWRRLSASSCAGWEGAIRLRTEGDELSLRITRHGLSVGTADGDADVDLRASQYQLLHLILGGLSADQLSFCNGLDLDGEALCLIDALFPPDQLFLWGRDGF